MTLAVTIPESARRFPDAVALEAASGWPLTYRGLHQISDRVAAALAIDHNVVEGDVVVLQLPSTIDYVVAYAALAKLGAITAGVNPIYSAAERRAVTEVAQPSLVLTTADLVDGVPPGVPTAVLTPATRPENLFGDMLAFLPRAAVAPPLAQPDDPQRVVCVVFTSGTTGTPKGAVFGNSELAAVTAADLGERCHQWGGGVPMIASTQFAHVGFMTKLPWYLQLGSRTLLLDQWKAGVVLAMVERHRLVTIGGVAPQVALMLRHPQFDQFDLSSVKTIVMGGAASPPELVREARRRFSAVYSIRYSSTESGGVGTATAFDADDHEALSTVGRPRGDVRIEIRGDDGGPLPLGEVGELCIRSSAMMRGYWRDERATAQVMPDGWLHTGDLAFVDERGLVHLAGRRTDMFIRGGYNVYPIEVESVLRDHPGVSDVAIVPRPDSVMGEIGVAVVVPNPTQPPPSLAEIRRFGALRLAHHKLPEAVVIVQELPLTAMQKVDRHALAEVAAIATR